MLKKDGIFELPSFLAGNEEVKLAILSAIASWAARFADALQPDLVSFLASGLKEKEALRRGHLRCLQAISKNPDALLQVNNILLFIYLFSWMFSN